MFSSGSILSSKLRNSELSAGSGTQREAQLKVSNSVPIDSGHESREMSYCGKFVMLRFFNPDTRVPGEIQGTDEKYELMKKWLETKGSPQSSIDRAVFVNERSIQKLDFEKFDIRKTS